MPVTISDDYGESDGLVVDDDRRCLLPADAHDIDEAGGVQAWDETSVRRIADIPIGTRVVVELGAGVQMTLAEEGAAPTRWFFFAEVLGHTGATASAAK